MKTRALALVLCLCLLMPGWAAAAGVEMDFKGADVRDVFRILGEMGGYNVLADESVRGDVTFHLQGLTVLEAIDLLARMKGYSYELVGNTLVVAPRERLKAGFVQEEVAILPVRHGEAGEVARILQVVLGRRDMEVDPARNLIIMRGSKADVARAKEFLAEYDQPPPVKQDFVDRDLVEVLGILAGLAGYDLLVEEGVGGRVTAYLQNLPAKEALGQVAQLAKVELEFEDSQVIVRSPWSSPGQNLGEKTKVIPLEYLDPERGLEIARLVLPKEKILVDRRSSLLSVRGQPGEVEAVEELIRQHDLPRLNLSGLVVRDGETLALLLVDEEAYLVRRGMELPGMVVRDVTSDGVQLELAGRVISLGFGGIGR